VKHPLITQAVIEKISSRSETWIKSKARIVVAPASNFNAQLVAATTLKNANIVGFCDKSTTLQGKEIGGISVYPYEKIGELRPSVIFVSSPLWEEDIFQTLQFYRDKGIDVVRSSDVIR
jgi:FlaA1/EpsC-like NDP-sugar epimerase